MEIVIATPALAGPGGVQSYVLTVAPQLLRLGHDVTVFADELGAAARLVEAHGIRVTDDEQALPERAGAVLSQDGPTAYRMAARFPHAVRWIVVHSPEYDVHLPPGLDGVVSTAVAMNGAVAQRLAALAQPPAVLRLRQPIDYTRLAAIGRPRAEAPRVLFLGNYLRDDALRELVAVCEDAGLPWRNVGVHGELLDDPGAALLETDIVVGMGRSILDGMSCGRAAWVASPSSGDGWITAESYPAVEDDGFRGRATGEETGAAAFARGLASYRPGMGPVNRGLILTHHSSYDHAAALSAALLQAAPDAPVDGPLDALAHLTRTQHDHQARVAALLRDEHALRDAWLLERDGHQSAIADRDRIQRDVETLVAERDDLWAGLRRESEERAEDLAVLADTRDRLAASEARYAALQATRRHRLADALGRPLDAVRRRPAGR